MSSLNTQRVDDEFNLHCASAQIPELLQPIMQPHQLPSRLSGSCPEERLIVDGLRLCEPPIRNTVGVHYAENGCGPPHVPALSLPSDARLPEKSSIMHNHLDFLPSLDFSPTTSPSASSPTSVLPSAFNSRKQSLGNLQDAFPDSMIPVFERMRPRLMSACFAFFVCGWGDGVTGTVLPYFEDDFHLSYMISSLLFVASTVGFGIGTALIERIMEFLGRFDLSSTTPIFVPAVPFVSRLFPLRLSDVKDSTPYSGIGHSASKARFLALFLGSILHACFFTIMGSQSGYASMLVGYAIAAFARSYITASLNAYVASTPKKPLGYILAFWSTGSFAAPIVCQTIIATGVPWPHFYLGSLVLSAMNTAFIVYAFRPTKGEYINERQAALDLARSRLGVPASAATTAVDVPSPDGGNSRSPLVVCVNAPSTSDLLRAFSMPYQWGFSVFAWIYSGSETTVQGFIVTYLLTTRHASPKTAGYVTSGFWGGMAMSRFMLGHYSPFLTFKQRRHIIHICIVVAITMHLLIWFVHSNVENAFSTALLGLMYGPIFPVTLGLANDILPHEVHMVSMAIISAFASFGAALFPFLTGLLSNIKGPHILSYVTVGQTVALFCLLCLFPSKKPSRMENRV